MEQYVSMTGVCGSFWQLSEDERLPVLSSLASVNEALSRVYDAGVRNLQGYCDAYAGNFVLNRNQYNLSGTVLTILDTDVPVLLSIFSQDNELLLGVDYRRIAADKYDFLEPPTSSSDGSIVCGTVFRISPMLGAKAATQQPVYQSIGVVGLARYAPSKHFIQLACMEFLRIPYASSYGNVLDTGLTGGPAQAALVGGTIDTTTETIPYPSDAVGTVKTGVVRPYDSVFSDRGVDVYHSKYDGTRWWQDSTELMKTAAASWFKGSDVTPLTGLVATVTAGADVKLTINNVDYDIPTDNLNAFKTFCGQSSLPFDTNALDAMMFFFGDLLLVIEFDPASQATKAEEAEDLYNWIRPFLPCNTIVKVLPRN